MQVFCPANVQKCAEMCNVYKQIVQKLSVPLDLSFLQNAYYQHFNSLCFVADSNRGPLACEAKEQSYNALNDIVFRLTFAFVQVACKPSDMENARPSRSPAALPDVFSDIRPSAECSLRNRYRSCQSYSAAFRYPFRCPSRDCCTPSP